MNRCKETVKRGLTGIKSFLKDKKGLSEIVQVVIVIGLVAIVAAKVLPPLALSMNEKSELTKSKLSALDKVYDDLP